MEAEAKIEAKKPTFAGLFTVTLATLMYEILLTRIFSVTMWYHFAFMAISIAMFGMTLGAILVYLFPNYFTPLRAKYHLGMSSLIFSATVIFSFLTYLCIPFAVHKSITGVYSIALTFVTISVPFMFSGICVCLALTKFPEQISKLYAADLSGAAVGCILVVYTLRLTDGPTAVVFVAFLASIGAVFFLAPAGSGRLGRAARWWSVSLLAFAAVHTVMVAKNLPLLRLMWVKGALEYRPLYEKWNSFSRVRVEDELNTLRTPFGWGLSSTLPPDLKVSQHWMIIDAAAGTVLTAYHGDPNEIDFLKYDVVNLAHYLGADKKVLVVGTGGGRDILSSLAFKQKSVLGVEINENVIGAVNETFGDFTGHLDRISNVVFVNDEARSYIARSKDRFDIIQISLIDTWAATAAGAFVLSENSLYTIEAWRIFLSHLTPKGILTVSRWYSGDRPGEVYRLVSLASSALGQLGVNNPRAHIIVVRCEKIGTILVSRDPFSEKDLETLQEVTDRLHFDLVLNPTNALDSTFATLASGKDLDQFIAGFPLNIAPPTDNSPFFFQMLRLRNAFSPEVWQKGAQNSYLNPIFVLDALLLTVLVLTFLCIFVPLIMTTDKGSLAGALPLFVFFSSIGLGYMFVEISQMQRLIVFLGHPTYAVSVVLFTLLLSSGLGSYSTKNVTGAAPRLGPALCLFALIAALLVFGNLTPHVIHFFQPSSTPLRLLVAAATLAPLGFFMGIPFPLGMKIAYARSSSVAPWLWGINGASSVCASVLAVAIALGSGIATAFWTGFACYVAAMLAYISARRKL